MSRLDITKNPLSTRLHGSKKVIDEWKATIDYYLANPITADTIQMWIDAGLKPKPLISTKDMPEDEWLAMREHGPNNDMPFVLGGSAISQITSPSGGKMSVSPWGTRMDLWYKKTGRKTAKELSGNNVPDNLGSLKAGNLFEDSVAESIKLMDGYEDTVVLNDYNFYQHPALPFLCINIDNIFIHNGIKKLGEIKTTSSRNFEIHRQWMSGVTPVYYEMQVRTYMAVLMELDKALVYAKWGFPPFEGAVTHIDRDLEIEALILNELVYFAAEVFYDQEPGYEGVTQGKLLLDAIRRIHGLPEERTVQIGKKHRRLFRKYQQQSEMLDQIEEEAKAKKDLIKDNVDLLEGKILALDPTADKLVYEDEKGVYTLERRVTRRGRIDKDSLIEDFKKDPSLEPYLNLNLGKMRIAAKDDPRLEKYITETESERTYFDFKPLKDAEKK